MWVAGRSPERHHHRGHRPGEDLHRLRPRQRGLPAGFPGPLLPGLAAPGPPVGRQGRRDLLPPAVPAGPNRPSRSGRLGAFPDLRGSGPRPSGGHRRPGHEPLDPRGQPATYRSLAQGHGRPHRGRRHPGQDRSQRLQDLPQRGVHAEGNRGQGVKRKAKQDLTTQPPSEGLVDYPGTGGRFPTERVASLDRNDWTAWPECAAPFPGLHSRLASQDLPNLVSHQRRGPSSEQLASQGSPCPMLH